MKGRDVGDHVIAGHHQQQRVGVGARHRKRNRGSGIARHGLDQKRWLMRAHLIAHRGDMTGAAQDDRRREPGVGGRALDGLLKQAFGAGQRQELLGTLAARFGPQPRSGAAAEDDGLNDVGHRARLSPSAQRVIPDCAHRECKINRQLTPRL